MMWRTADPVWSHCVKFLAKHFEAVTQAAPDAIQTLSADAITEAAACSCLSASEIIIFCAMEAWALGTRMSLDAPAVLATAKRPCTAAPTHSLAQAVPDIRQALEHIRFPLMTAVHLERVDASHLWQLLGYRDAYSSDVGPTPDGGSSSEDPPHAAPEGAQQGLRRSGARVCLPQDLRRMWRHQRRTPANATAELQFVHAGDKNGALYHLGTNSGMNSRFVNPHLTGAVQAMCSSPFCSESDAGKLTSRVYHGDQCAHANGAGEVFWQVNLKGRAVVCLEYVIRVNDSAAFPRSWLLQGGHSGGSWVDLHSVCDCLHFQSKGQYGVWHVEQPLMQPFSSIRLLLIGQASNGSRVLNVNFIELYGYLIHDVGSQ